MRRRDFLKILGIAAAAPVAVATATRAEGGVIIDKAVQPGKSWQEEPVTLWVDAVVLPKGYEPLSWGPDGVEGLDPKKGNWGRRVFRKRSDAAWVADRMKHYPYASQYLITDSRGRQVGYHVIVARSSRE